jgi:ATP-binding cassette, subfamily A (ABC1), member 3
LAISSVVYLLLAWFVASFFPGQYGTPVNIADLFGKNTEKNDLSDPEALPMTRINRRLEPVDDGQISMVKIENLSKIFKSLWHPSCTAVCDFLLNIYKNQITVLLGHNRAGKTTTMSMLTGTLSRSSGSIAVDGFSNVNSYGSLIGFCPQHNCFIPYLTCMEHLLFFGQLRGLSVTQARKHAIQVLKDVNLTDKSDVLPRKLSEGMKRRLSLANAIVGNTKVLVLDEPSSGLDSESCRELWDVLFRLKKTRTILVSTNNAEEAEMIGDKIAIMENGKVIASGTSMILKQNNGDGCRLKLVKSDMKTFCEESVLKLIRKTIPDAKIKKSDDSMMCVVLPLKNQNDNKRVLEQLKTRQLDFGIQSIDVMNTTLEEVLMK